MTADSGASSTSIDRQIPLVVTVTRVHVVWIDADEGEDAADVAASWIEEPYDLLTDLTDKNADDWDWQVEYAPHDTLLRQHGFGPTFPSGAYCQAEDDRYQQYISGLSS